MPTISYDDFSLRKRLWAFLLLLVYGTITSSSINCMVIGLCHSWAWIFTILMMILPGTMLLFYIIYTQESVDAYDKIKQVFADDSDSDSNDSDNDKDSDDSNSDKDSDDENTGKEEIVNLVTQAYNIMQTYNVTQNNSVVNNQIIVDDEIEDELKENVRDAIQNTLLNAGIDSELIAAGLQTDLI